MTVVAPVLVITSGSTDNTPTFQLIGDIKVGDVVTLERADNSNFTSPTDVTNTVDSTEFSTGFIKFSTGALANGTWYFRAKTDRAGDVSPWSNVPSVTINVTDGGGTPVPAIATAIGMGIAHADGAAETPLPPTLPNSCM